MVTRAVVVLAGIAPQPVGARPHGAVVTQVIVGQGEEHNPVLPETSEWIYAALSLAFVAIPVFIVAFVVRQLVLTRRAAERAADAAERAASTRGIADEDDRRRGLP